MRTERTMCPKCNTTIKLVDQVLCIEHVYFGITDTCDILFCENCNDFIMSDNEECTEKKHKIIKDKKIVVDKMMEKYSEAKYFFNLFYGKQ